MMEYYLIEQTATGVLLWHGDAEDEEDAWRRLCEDAAFHDTARDDGIAITDAEEVRLCIAVQRDDAGAYDVPPLGIDTAEYAEVIELHGGSLVPLDRLLGWHPWRHVAELYEDDEPTGRLYFCAWGRRTDADPLEARLRCVDTADLVAGPPYFDAD